MGPDGHVREYVPGPTYEELATTLEATDVIVGLALHAYARSIYYDDDFHVGNLVLRQTGPVFIDHDCFISRSRRLEGAPVHRGGILLPGGHRHAEGQTCAPAPPEDINVYDDEVESYGVYVRRVGLGADKCRTAPSHREPANSPAARGLRRNRRFRQNGLDLPPSVSLTFDGEQ